MTDSGTFYRRPTATDRQDRGSFHLGRFFGIPTRIHWSWFAIIAFWTATTWSDTASVEATLTQLGFTVAVFASVLFHEFGHALAARRFGLRTRRVTLFLIGGVAELERAPDDPRSEMWIALAGPLVNFAITGLLAIVVFTTGLATGQVSRFLIELGAANLALGIFNLVPAFPMDGGRVFRALLERKRGRLAATEIAAKLGRWVALGLAAWGVWTSAWLMVLVAGFIWLAARRELWQVRQLALLEQERLAQAAWVGGFTNPGAAPRGRVITIEPG